MSGQQSSKLANDEPVEEYEYLKKIFLGLVSLAVLYTLMGFVMILIANSLATMQLNTGEVFNTIGRIQHLDGIRFGTSSMFFLLATFSFIFGWIYLKNPKRSRWSVILLSIIYQPWLPLVCLSIAGVWAVQALEPDGNIAEAFASLYKLDVKNTVDAVQYQYIMSTMPTIEFLMFAIGCFALMPFSQYSSRVIIQSLGRSKIPRKNELVDLYDWKNQVFAGKKLVNGGILYTIIGILLIGVGIVLAIGIDLTWPLFKLENYKLFITVYPIFPISFGLFCIITGSIYIKTRMHPAVRIMAWVTIFIQIIIPIMGWFYVSIIVRDLWVSRLNIEKKQHRLQVTLGLVIATAILMFSLIFIIIISA